MGVKKTIIRRRKKLVVKWEEVPLRSKMYCVLDRTGLPNVEMPTWATFTRSAVFGFMNILSIAICLSIIIESLPRFAELSRPNRFSYVEMVCVLMFTIDWVARLVSTPNPGDYLRNGLNIVDLLGLLPFWLEFGGVLDPGISKWVLVLRVTRLVRALLYDKRYEILIETVEESTEVGALLVMILIATLPMFGSALYFAERGSWNSNLRVWERPCPYHVECAVETSPFQNAADGMWFVMSAVTTLGYGDIYPTSDTGKVLGALTMMVGVFVLSFPVMILAVNFEHERHKLSFAGQRQAAKEGLRLQELQAEHTTMVEKLGEASTKVGAGVALGNTPPSRIEPIFFQLQEDKIMRRAVMTSAIECRYDPLISMKRRDDGTIVLQQHARNPTVFKFSIILGSDEASTEARNTMHLLLPPDCPSVARCRHFHVPEVHYDLHLPEVKCEFLRSVKLLVQGEDGIEPSRKEVHGELELVGWKGELDEQSIRDFSHSLHRCRLHITAAVAYEEPKMYEVPVFFDMLKATNLVRSLLAHKRGLVYLTETQVTNLINGVHHLFDLAKGTDDEYEIVINVNEVNKAIAKAVLSSCAAPCDDPSLYQISDFLYPEVLPKARYYGVFTSRLTGLKEEKGWYAWLCGEEEEDVEDRDQRILCNVTVKTVIPNFHNAIVTL